MRFIRLFMHARLALPVGLFLLGLALSTSIALWKQHEIGLGSELQFQQSSERVNATLQTEPQRGQITPWWIFFAGTLFSGLLALLVRQQILGRSRAEQLAQMAQVVQHTFNAVSITDREGIISWVNPGFERITGYRAVEAVGKTHAELIGSEKADPLARTQLAEAVRSGTHCRVEILNQSKEGSDFWVDTEIQPQFDADGQVTGFMEISSDISTNKRAEARMLAQQELMQSILDNIPIGLSAFDSELHLIAKNQEFQTALEFPDALFSGPITTFESIIRFNAERGEYGEGDHSLAVQTIIERARHPVLHQLERVRPNGVVLEVRGAPLPGGGFVTAYADISERKKSQLQIQNSAQLLRGAIAAIDQAFALYDEDDRLVFFNEKYASLFGSLKDKVLLGASFADLIRMVAELGIYLEAHGRVDEWLAERMATYTLCNASMMQTTADGRVFNIIDRRLPDGQTVCFLIDVTEFVRATQAAESANVAKSQFLANMSHEIRTPMNGVMGMLALLKESGLNDRQRDYAQNAEGAARSLLGILNDILDFSKVEAGKLELDPEPFSMADVTHDLHTILSANLKEKQISLKFELDPELPLLVIGDAGRLRQVLINLGGNAIKFTAKGEVTIRVRVRRRDSSKVVLAFEVIDSGIGLSPEQQRRVFTGFSQAEASTSRRFGGTGLGLAISQRLVTLMGGEIKVTSSLGAGSTFYFDLHFPLCEQPISAATESMPNALQKEVAVSEPRLAGLRVLLVEDNLINQIVARELLGIQGALVQLAANGQLAVDALLTHPTGFDVVLMDLQMPVMDGLQATRHIRQQLKLTRLPIIAMTANVMESDREDCLAAGMNDHIGKPFNVKDLVACLLRFTVA